MTFRRIPLALLLAVLPALTGCKYFQQRVYSIPSDSMSPTIRKDDRVLVSFEPSTLAGLHDGDIIAFHHNGYVILKRIIGMPGETIRGENRKVFRNDQPLDEPYLAPPVPAEDATVSFEAQTVPAGELFVLGDNRDNSLDSHVKEFGPVYRKDVVGKVIQISDHK